MKAVSKAYHRDGLGERRSGMVGNGEKPSRTRWLARVVVDGLIPIAALLLLTALVWQHGTLPYPDAQYSYSDHYRYLAMAANPFAASYFTRYPPYCWRILVPWIVAAIRLAFPSLSPVSGFRLLTLLGLAGSTLALQDCVRALGRDRLPRGVIVASGLAFVTLGPATGFMLWDPMLVDPIAMFLVLAVCACAVRATRSSSRWRGWQLIPLAMVGGLTKETIVLALGFALAWAWAARDRRLGVIAGAGLVLALVELEGLHIAIPAGRPYSLLDQVGWVASFAWSAIFASATYPTTLRAVIHLQTVYWGLRLIAAVAGSWGLLLPLALFAFRRTTVGVVRTTGLTWREWTALGAFVLAATAQMFVSVAVERVVVYAAPALIIAACFGVEELAKGTARWLRLSLPVARWAVWTPVLLAQLYWALPYAGWRSVSNVFPPTFFSDLDWPHRILLFAVFIAVVTLEVPWLISRWRQVRSPAASAIG